MVCQNGDDACLDLYKDFYFSVSSTGSSRNHATVGVGSMTRMMANVGTILHGILGPDVVVQLAKLRKMIPLALAK